MPGRGINIGFNRGPTTMFAATGKYGVLAPVTNLASVASGAFTMAAGAGSFAMNGQAVTLANSGSLPAVTQFQLVAQGGSTNNQGTVTSPKMQQMLVWAPVSGAHHYQIIRRTNYGTDVDYATTTNNWYVDTSCPNFFNAANIAQGPGSPIGPTTVYDYDVVAVDAGGARGPKPQQFTMWGYRGGITGTATGGSTTTLVDSGKSWTTNQWLGYYVFVGSQTAVIVSNTATTLNLVDLDGNALGSAISSGNTYQIGGDYFNGVGDVSFGKSAISFTSTGGSPVAPHAFCLALTHDATASDTMGLQRPSASPAGFIYGLEVGAFNYAIWTQRPDQNGMVTEFAVHHRGPPGDLAGPHTNIDGTAILSYGPSPLANTWQTYKVPLSAIQFSSPAGGITTFSFSLTGSTLTVSNIAGPGLDNGVWITGTGIPTGTYIQPTPGQSGNGTYGVAGAGIPVGSTVSGNDGQGWSTNWYKGQYKDVSHNDANQVVYYDDIGWVRSNSVAAGA